MFGGARELDRATARELDKLGLTDGTVSSRRSDRASFCLDLGPEVTCYARNDRLGFAITYDFMGAGYPYESAFLVWLANGVTLVLEIKGIGDGQHQAKHEAAPRTTWSSPSS